MKDRDQFKLKIFLPTLIKGSLLNFWLFHSSLCQPFPLKVGFKEKLDKKLFHFFFDNFGKSRKFEYSFRPDTGWHIHLSYHYFEHWTFHFEMPWVITYNFSDGKSISSHPPVLQAHLHLQVGFPPHQTKHLGFRICLLLLRSICRRLHLLSLSSPSASRSRESVEEHQGWQFPSQASVLQQKLRTLVRACWAADRQRWEGFFVPISKYFGHRDQGRWGVLSTA